MSAASATYADSVVGRSSPLGASIVPDGVNFSVYSRSATGVDLLLFDRNDDSLPSRVIPINPVENRTYHYWHMFVPGLRQRQLYGYRVHGPYDPASGMWFDPGKVLLDPYGRGVAVPAGYSRDAARLPGDNINNHVRPRWPQAYNRLGARNRNLPTAFKKRSGRRPRFRVLVECPSHNVIISDPSDNHGTETRSAVTDRRSTSRIEVVGRVTDAAGRRCIPGAADFGLGRGSEQQPDYELAFHDGTHDFTLEAAV